MRIGQPTDPGLYPVEYEMSAVAPHNESLSEAAIVNSSLAIRPSIEHGLDVSEEYVSRLTDLSLRIREIEAHPDISRLDFSDLLRHEGRASPPSIHLHSTEDLTLLSDALQLFVQMTPQRLLYLESRGAQPENYADRRGAAEIAKAMHTQIHALLGATALSPMSAKASSQASGISPSVGHYI